MDPLQLFRNEFKRSSFLIARNFLIRSLNLSMLQDWSTLDVSTFDFQCFNVSYCCLLDYNTTWRRVKQEYAKNTEGGTRISLHIAGTHLPDCTVFNPEDRYKNLQVSFPPEVGSYVFHINASLTTNRLVQNTVSILGVTFRKLANIADSPLMYFLRPFI